MELPRCLLPQEQTPQSLSTPGGPPRMVHLDTAKKQQNDKVSKVQKM